MVKVSFVRVFVMDRYKRKRKEGGEYSEREAELRVQGNRCASEAYNPVEIWALCAFSKEALSSMFPFVALLRQSINQYYWCRGRR